MKYREQRGGLAESMKNIFEFSSIDEIIEHLNKSYSNFGRYVSEIKFKHIGFDERNKWNTYIVLFRFYGDKIFSVAGFSDGYLKQNNLK